MIDSAVVIGEGGRIITKEDLKIGRSEQDQAPPTGGKWTLLEEAERKCVSDALNCTDWDKPKAMEALGLSKTALNDKIRKYGLEQRQYAQIPHRQIKMVAFSTRPKSRSPDRILDRFRAALFIK